MSKLAFVINPVSGTKKAMRLWRKIEASGLLENIDHKVHFTGWSGHASLLTRQALEEGTEKIIVVGGDGTLNECINGYMLCEEEIRKHAAIGLIPYGTGSDWARHHKIPKDILSALTLCLKANPVLHDVGEIRYKRLGAIRSRYFLNISTICFGALAANSANEYKAKGKSGKRVYIRAVLKHLFGYKSSLLKITIDDQEIVSKVFMIATGICSSNGAGLKLCPGAVSDDGYFYVTRVEDISAIEVLKNIFGLYNGKFIKHPQVHIHKAKTLSAQCDDGYIDLEVDGEYLGKSDCEYRMHAGKLRVLLSRAGEISGV